MSLSKKSTVLASAFGMSLVFAARADEAPAPVPVAPGAPVTTAGTAAAPVAQAPQPSFGMSVIPFVLVFGIMYFLMIRPQQKRMKEQQDMLSALKQGDEVVTSSGFLGTVREIAEKVVTLELASNVRVRVLKSQIAQVVKGQVKDLTA